jgi:hypothetical protein
MLLKQKAACYQQADMWNGHTDMLCAIEMQHGKMLFGCGQQSC